MGIFIHISAMDPSNNALNNGYEENRGFFSTRGEKASSESALDLNSGFL